MLSTYTEQTGSATVTASISDTHRMLQCVRADMESPRQDHRLGLNHWPHLIVGFDRYKAVSFRVVDCGDPEVTSSNLEFAVRSNKPDGNSRIDGTHLEHRTRRQREGSRKYVQSNP